MKEIKAYIRNNMVDDVVDALEAMPGVPGVAVVPVSGFGHVHDDGAAMRVQMTKLEVDVPDEQVEPVVDCIVRHARTGTGHPGDGKICVCELAQAVRIADGALGAEALERAP